jgi:MATE family multidrug resistance protein
MQSTAIQPARAGTLGELLRVALPLVISYGSTAMMYVIDRIFLSWDSVDSMAAALPAGVLHYNLAILAIGTVAYGNAFIGQYEGAGQHHRVGPVVWQGIYFSIVAALVMLLFAPLAPSIFSVFGHDVAVQGFEARYFKILCLGTLPLLLDTALSCFFSGRGQTLVVMVVNTIGMLINILLDYLLIFGKAGFPKMGIDGAAIATVTAFASISLMYVAAMYWMYRRGPYRLWVGRRFDRELFARLLRFGFPSGMQQFLDIGCWTVFVQLVGRLGREELSATSLVFNLNGGVFIPLLGLGTAVTVLVGHRIGEGRPQLAVRTTWLAFALASGYTLLFCGVYLFLPDLILKPYGLAERPELRATVVSLLRFVAFYSFFDSMLVVFNAAIRGAGDTRFAMTFSFSMGLLLLVLPTYVASTVFGTDGFSAAWYAVTVYITVLGLGFMARFQQGRWKSMKVIEHTAADLPIDAIDDGVLDCAAAKPALPSAVS